MSIQTMLTQLRLEVDDLKKTRWTDDQLKTFLYKSIRRVNQLAIKFELDFAQQHDEVTLKPDGTIEGIDYTNVNATCAMFRKDTKQRITQLLPMQWNKLVESTPAEFWSFVNGQAYYATPLLEDTPAVFIYYPRQSVNTTESPWDGRLDDIVVEYAAFRAKNVDEMNVQADQQMMNELERRLIENYVRLGPQMAAMRGWNL
jgi:hypothetical protein